MEQYRGREGQRQNDTGICRCTINQQGNSSDDGGLEFIHEPACILIAMLNNATNIRDLFDVNMMMLTSEREKRIAKCIVVRGEYVMNKKRREENN